VAERVDAIRYVVCVRSPLETAASMVRRDRYPGVDHADWGALWLDYLARALAASRGGDRRFVFYDDLLRDPRAQADRLAGWLGVSALPDAALAGAVDGSLRHHAASASETAADTRLPGAARAAYAALQAAATAPAELAGALTHGAEALAAEHVAARAARAVERGSLEETLAALQAADVREDGLRIALRETQEQVKRLNAALADARGARLAA
jgi:hypothetical protein